MHFLKKLQARYYRSKVTLKVCVKSNMEGYDNELGEFLISISRSNIFKGNNELNKLRNTEKEKIISAIQSQINKKYGYVDYDKFSYSYGFESWEIVEAKVEPKVHWKWIIRLSFIPIFLFAALPSFVSEGNFNVGSFLFLLPYGIIYLVFNLIYMSLLYFICYALWGQVFGYDIREERATNRIFILSIIAMSHGLFVEYGNRIPTKIEQLIVAPHILLNGADWDWDSFEE